MPWFKKECLMIANNTAINGMFTDQSQEFDMMYNRKAFLHWVLKEGMY